MAAIGSMSRRLEVYGLAALVLGGVLVGFFKLMQTGYSTSVSLQALACCGPLILVCLLAIRPLWVGLGLGAVALTSETPLPMLHRTEVGMLLCVVVGAGTILWRFTNWRGRPRVELSRGAGAFLLMALWIWVRFLVERPGSAHMGDRGGIGEASMFLLGTFAYFVLAANTAEDWDARRNTRWLVGLLVLGAGVDYALGFFDEFGTGLLSVFGRQVWFLCALLLAWGIQRSLNARESLRGAFLFYGSAALMFLLAMLTPHRSRPLYAAGILLAVTTVFRVSRRFVFFLGVLVVLGASIVLFVGLEHIPLRAVRSLSTILPVPEQRLRDAIWEYQMSYETGWESSFRHELNQIAARSVRQHPVAGRGFSFSQQELAWALSRGGHYADAAQGLAVSGMFHNSVVELAVFCGLPAAVLFACAYGLGCWNFWQVARRIREPRLKLLCAASLGYLIAETGQMLINGGARDFFYVCAILGFMKGICLRVEREPQLTQEPAGPLADAAALGGAPRPA